MFYLILVLLSLIGLLLAQLYLQYSRLGRIVNSIPGPPKLPLLGNILSFQVTLVGLNDLLREWSKKYYPIYKVWFFHRPLIVIRHPDDLEILLTSPKHVDKEFAYEYFEPWLKTGLLTSSGQKWHQRRKILTPGFHFSILKKYMEMTNEEGERFIGDIRAEGKETKQSLLPFFSKVTLNIICESAMGVKLSDKENESSSAYKDAIYRIGNVIVYRMIRPYILDWMINFMPKFKTEIKEVLQILSGFTDKIVKERRVYHESTGFKDLKDLQSNSNQHSDHVYFGSRKRLAMLDLLLNAEKDGLIDDAGIKEEVSTFIFEGHDTTTMGLTFTILLLAENPKIQNLARKEVEEILSAKNGVLDISDLQKMNYLEMCIKESLRMFPSVPMVSRKITEDIQLKSGLIPKGSDILLTFIDVHRDPEFWPEPEKFDPDRFLPDEIRKRHPFAYLPFSAGSRNCIGQKFAMMELKSLISRILYNFYLEPIDYTHNIKIMSDLVLRPSEPVHTKFIRIDRR